MSGRPIPIVFLFYFLILASLVIYTGFDVMSVHRKLQQRANLIPTITKLSEGSSDEVPSVEGMRRKILERDLDNMPLNLIYSWYNYWAVIWAAYTYTEDEKLLKCKKGSDMPNMQKIVFKNQYWQYMEHSEGKAPLYFYSAHLDQRMLLHNYYVVRILFFHKGPLGDGHDEFPLKLYCNVWYDGRDDRKIISVLPRKVKFLQTSAGVYKTFMPTALVCNLPYQNGTKPVAVSIHEEPCVPKLQNALTLQDRHKGPDGVVGLCLKQVYAVSTDRTIRFLEWLEIQRAMKIDKVLVYVLSAHENLRKLFDYYVKIGFVDTIPVSTPLDFQTHDWWIERELRRNQYLRRGLEVIFQNDCLYRLHAHYRYVAICDSDEIFLPRDESNLPAFLLNQEKEVPVGYEAASFVFWGSFFPKFESKEESALLSKITYKGKTVPQNLLYILKYVYRTEDKFPTRAKSIHRTEYRTWTGTHRGSESIGKHFTIEIDLKWEDALLAHYRGGEWRKSEYSHKVRTRFHDPQLLRRDPIIWRYRDEVLKGMFNTMRQIWPNESVSKFLVNLDDEDF